MLFSNTIDISSYKENHSKSIEIFQLSILLLGSFGNKFSPMNKQVMASK